MYNQVFAFIYVFPFIIFLPFPRHHRVNLEPFTSHLRVNYESSTGSETIYCFSYSSSVASLSHFCDNLSLVHFSPTYTLLGPYLVPLLIFTCHLPANYEATTSHLRDYNETILDFSPSIHLITTSHLPSKTVVRYVGYHPTKILS